MGETCLKCGSENTEFKSGVSKKSGRPWAANRCNDCREMNWIRQQGGGFSEAQSYTPVVTKQKDVTYLASIEAKVDEILRILKKRSTDMFDEPRMDE